MACESRAMRIFIMLPQGNISSALAHIESARTYRKSCKRFISMKKRHFPCGKMSFFMVAGGGLEPPTSGLPSRRRIVVYLRLDTLGLVYSLLWTTPFEKTVINCFFRTNPTSYARRTHNPRNECIVFLLEIIKITPPNRWCYFYGCGRRT